MSILSNHLKAPEAPIDSQLEVYGFRCTDKCIDISGVHWWTYTLQYQMISNNLHYDIILNLYEPGYIEIILPDDTVKGFDSIPSMLKYVRTYVNKKKGIVLHDEYTI